VRALEVVRPDVGGEAVRVLFARARASSSVSNGVIATTGPKISSWKMRASGATSANTVGRRSCLEALGRPPPATRRPSPLPIST
jgi:hypothetical protein